MSIMVVYESVFGNTRYVAEAVAAGLREADPDAQVACLPVAEATPDTVSTADVLVVGGPTHMHGMTTHISRTMGAKAEADAAAKGEEAHPVEPGVEGPGLRDWFHRLHRARRGGRAAAFDTRAGARFAGGAAPGIARRLRHLGYELLGEPQGFLIDDTAGPLAAGEIERAREWGRSLLAEVSSGTA